MVSKEDSNSLGEGSIPSSPAILDVYSKFIKKYSATIFINASRFIRPCGGIGRHPGLLTKQTLKESA